jgi:hypothetical protein
MGRPPAAARLPLMALALLALFAALAGGLVRLGWALPGVPPALAGLHGPLLVSGFLGTLIGVERGMALGGLAYLPPLLTGGGALVLVLGAPGRVGAALITAGSVALLGVVVRLFRRTPAGFLATMAVGVAAWVVGNVLWLRGWPVYRVVPWWAGFLVLVIAGERQELTRLVARPAWAGPAFAAAVAGLVLALVAGTRTLDAGMRLTGAALLVLALWLARHDLARRTVREPGLPRFMGAALLSGYAWLGVAGLLALRLGGVVAGPHYDAVLHALFVGFVFAMIFAHAPVIFPAVLARPVAFRRSFWVHLALLHAGLALRLAGDLLPSTPARQWGGLLNAAAILLFFANTLAAVLAGGTFPRAQTTGRGLSHPREKA